MSARRVLPGLLVAALTLAAGCSAAGEGEGAMTLSEAGWSTGADDAARGLPSPEAGVVTVSARPEALLRAAAAGPDGSADGAGGAGQPGSPEVRLRTSAAATAFDQLCAGEVDLVESEEQISPAQWRACRQRGLGVVELQLAQRATVLAVGADSGRDQACAPASLLPALQGPPTTLGTWSQLGQDDAPLEGAGPGAGSVALRLGWLLGSPAEVSSAASLPGETIQLTVRAQGEKRPGQSVSRWLVERAQVGDIVHLSQAEGDFVLEESPATPTNNHLLFLTGGSGITPAMSILRTLLRDGYDGKAGRRVTFLHFARSAEDQIFAEELAQIAAADNDVDVVLRHGSVFSEFELRRLVPSYAATDTWACGPGPMLDLVREAYAESPRLRTELFNVASVVPSGAAEGDVAFSRSGKQAANTGTTLLEQAEALGLRPTSGCRMGICFSCTATKSSGTVRNVLTGEESALPDEEVRVCVTAPVGDCVVDL